MRTRPRTWPPSLPLHAGRSCPACETTEPGPRRASSFPSSCNAFSIFRARRPHDAAGGLLPVAASVREALGPAHRLPRSRGPRRPRRTWRRSGMASRSRVRRLPSRGRSRVRMSAHVQANAFDAGRLCRATTQTPVVPRVHCGSRPRSPEAGRMREPRVHRLPRRRRDAGGRVPRARRAAARPACGTGVRRYRGAAAQFIVRDGFGAVASGCLSVRRRWAARAAATGCCRCRPGGHRCPHRVASASPQA